MILLRLLSLWMFLLAIVAIAVDVTRSFATNEMVITSMGEHWYEFNPNSLKGVQTFIEVYLHPFLWNSIVFNILTWPSWLVLPLMSLIFYLIGRKRYKTSVYIN
ncbi:MAG: hypothetical protein AAF228_07195 [Pseudomonadota bacterium]